MNASVAVIGTIFIDCKGFAQNKYLAESRNLGSIQFVHGGVARNVAENLAGLDVPVAFITTADESGLGSEVLDRLAARGVQIDGVCRTKDRGMGMWLAILDETGDLAGSISQMPELQPLGDWLQTRADELVQRWDHIVLELDLNERISGLVRQAAAKAGKPVYGIPGNLDVVLRHPELLQGLACFICNHHEAGRLWGRELDAELEAAAASMEASATTMAVDGDADGANAKVMDDGSAASTPSGVTASGSAASTASGATASSSAASTPSGATASGSAASTASGATALGSAASTASGATASGSPASTASGATASGSAASVASAMVSAAGTPSGATGSSGEASSSHGFAPPPYAELLEQLRTYVARSGLHAMVVTLGAQGSLYYDAQTGSSGYQPALPVRMVDSSGAGDAFFSGTVTGIVRGLPLSEAVRLGTQVAAWTIESAENTCPDLRDKLQHYTESR